MYSLEYCTINESYFELTPAKYWKGENNTSTLKAVATFWNLKLNKIHGNNVTRTETNFVIEKIDKKQGRIKIRTSQKYIYLYSLIPYLYINFILISSIVIYLPGTVFFIQTFYKSLSVALISLFVVNVFLSFIINKIWRNLLTTQISIFNSINHW